MRRKLTLSHLAVTIISILLLELLILGGYLLYLRMDVAAQATGVDAAYAAEDIGWWLEDTGLRFTSEVARRYIVEETIYPLLDEEDGEGEEEAWLIIDGEELMPYQAEWVVLFSPDGEVLASNDERRFVPGTMIDDLPLPRVDRAFFEQPISIDEEDLFLPMSYLVVDDAHVGQSVILDADNEVLGWFYLYDPNVINPYTSTEAAQALGFGFLAAALIAMFVSGIMGVLLARSFSRRFMRLSEASAALAAGELERRVVVTGNDEIEQMGAQFNAMADQIGMQMQQLHDLAERNALLAEEARALAALEERQRLARDLHDAVKQQIFGLSLTAGSIRLLMKRKPEQAAERLTQLAQQAQDVYTEMDRIIHQLRPAALEDHGLALALPQLVERWQQQHNIPVELEIKGERELPLVTEHALYRVCQEALNNIARHAQASHVTLILAYDMDYITLQLSDNGRGFEHSKPQPTQAMGLRGMKERIEEINGIFRLTSQIDEGTSIYLTVPAKWRE